MININLEKLNSLEKYIHTTLTEHSKKYPRFRISEAAELCQCSTSKISKFVKKLGFTNFKQYLDFLYGEDMNLPKPSTELNRITDFIAHFDSELVTELWKLIQAHPKIVLFGYGPSFLCAQYFEYRLRTISNKTVMALPDQTSVASMVDQDTLLIILTVTGTFRSFEKVYHDAKAKGCNVAMLVEEYNMQLFDQCDKIFFLSPAPQPSHLKPYEKSRTIFFLFLEEVIQLILHGNQPL